MAKNNRLFIYKNIVYQINRCRFSIKPTDLIFYKTYAIGDQNNSRAKFDALKYSRRSKFKNKLVLIRKSRKNYGFSTKRNLDFV